MGKDKRQWRKQVKKLRRSRKRQSMAENRNKGQGQPSDIVIPSEREEDSDEDLSKRELLEEEKRWHDLEEEAWLERERQANIIFEKKKDMIEKMAQAEANKKERIRIEWEEKQAIEAKQKAEADRIAKKNQEKQEAEFNQLLEFLSGDIETPPLPYLMAESTGSDDAPCLYFSRTGACRFHERCNKPHPSPALSSTILITNFFSHISLEHSSSGDTDADLEYEDSELRTEFLSFYDDVLPEFRKHGTVMQFKVCRNFEPHLRGNVYIQYLNIKESVNAYRKFNARFYNGKQLSLRFVKLAGWRSAICGAFNRGVCLKGRTCNYLHVFRNPTHEFLAADRDWEVPVAIQKSNSPRSRGKPPISLPGKTMDCIENKSSRQRREGKESTRSRRTRSRSHPRSRSSNDRTFSSSRRRSESRSTSPSRARIRHQRDDHRMRSVTRSRSRSSSNLASRRKSCSKKSSKSKSKKQKKEKKKKKKKSSKNKSN